MLKMISGLLAGLTLIIRRGWGAEPPPETVARVRPSARHLSPAPPPNLTLDDFRQGFAEMEAMVDTRVETVFMGIGDYRHLRETCLEVGAAARETLRPKAMLWGAEIVLSDVAPGTFRVSDGRLEITAGRGR